MSGRKLRILCIHGYRQNSRTFYQKLGSLRKSSKSLAEYIIPTAPLKVPDKLSDEDDAEFGWWFSHKTDDGSHRYNCLIETEAALDYDISLRFMQQFVSENGPFDGIVAFSQGASFASLIMNNIKGLKFVILFSGFITGQKSHRPSSMEKTENIETIHVYGLNDQVVPVQLSRRLAECYERKTIVEHEGGHFIHFRDETKSTVLTLMNISLKLLRHLSSFIPTVVLVLIPIVALPILLQGDEEWRKAIYIMIVVGSYWVTETLPLTISAFLPAILVPAFGIMTGKEVAIAYMNDVLLLLFGGMAFGSAIERSNLHQRIALKLLLIFGASSISLVTGLMISSAFLSMWINNTATTVMLLPIGREIISKLEEVRLAHEKGEINETFEMESTINLEIDEKIKKSEEIKTNVQTLSEENEKLIKGMSLGIAYASSVGGSMTLIGTGPNTILKGMLDRTYPKNDLSFFKFMMFAVPNGILIFLGTYIVIICMFCRSDLIILFKRVTRRSETEESMKDKSNNIRTVLRQKYKDLGKFKWAEIWVLIFFILVILLWLSRDPQFCPGWGTFFTYNGKSYATDSLPIIFVLVMMFIIPKENIFNKQYWKKNNRGSILTWKFVESKVPWGMLILIGGGFVISEASKKTGLTKVLADELKGLVKLGEKSALFLLIMTIGLLTELMSNSAVATLSADIMMEIAINASLHPLYFALPCIISNSMAFMFPVATPPNAIAYSMGNIRMIEMIRTGILLNILAYIFIFISAISLGEAVFHLSRLPKWMN
ncbi:hypothetical protein SNEBB_003159 [Seison nebaliae]|nr:hypothetical protein SNEBB_003159 [Seison nebaliae]